MSEFQLSRDGYPTAVLSSREAAAYLNIAQNTLYRWVKTGKLPHMRMGRTICFRLKDLEDFLEGKVSTKWKRYEKETPEEWCPECDPEIRDALAHGMVELEDLRGVEIEPEGEPELGP